VRTELRTGIDSGGIAAWRREQLARSGFPPALAARLAGDPDYDLHRLIELVERGCSPELAVRILAPLEQGPAA
jgi:hypothetical protein